MGVPNPDWSLNFHAGEKLQCECAQEATYTSRTETSWGGRAGGGSIHSSYKRIHPVHFDLPRGYLCQARHSQEKYHRRGPRISIPRKEQDHTVDITMLETVPESPHNELIAILHYLPPPFPPPPSPQQQGMARLFRKVIP